ncbi:hypothetical protein [Xenorhabdus bovienii]|uniref:hypothetical protein n=1 Tax=Xenorhabdus bovienii TaxID=40576 RepID=UPI0023B35281|nr:hypothetical protein [Xenorhabdus bovienii]MDE9432678.1 hypothetical protein [Xenorhabdus bovienii]MDE9456759.1 hypothetical protein [Xenorhabdus bovienii]MDE9490454.1 hypothetical protein [Xenorhabdus bovienii]MDE9506730.1 hypothetical protein [Xenorhabdus bovienii]MDE9513330.1 hypothetical protein [Xenorhabdus bovienii]
MIEFKPLSRTPNETLCNSHYFCDYIELLALVDCDDGISINDVYDRFLEDGKITGIGSELGSEINEDWMGRITNWFTELNSRATHYSIYYPFIYNGSRIKKKDSLSEVNYLYIFLLLCSSLKYIEKYQCVTTIFEKLSYFAMKKYLPDIAEVHVFGISSDRNSRYNGSLEKKFIKLSKDLGLTMSNRSNIFKTGDNGDGGIDIIAWVPFKDDPNMDRKQIFMGQSASGKNWANKQASVDRVKNYLIDLPDNSQNVLFVPYDFRDFDRNFCQSNEITASIIFDRHRILNLVSYDDIVHDSLGNTFQSIIDYTLDYEEDIV